MNIKNKKLSRYKDQLHWDITYSAACNNLETIVEDSYIWFNDYDCSKPCFKVKVDYWMMKNGWHIAKLAEDMGNAKSGDIVSMYAAEVTQGYYNRLHSGDITSNTLPKLGDFKEPHACFNFETLYGG